MVKVILSVLTGIVISFFLVIKPLSGRFLALKALTIPMEQSALVNILIESNNLDKCNTSIIDMIGMRALQNKQGQVALWAYGEAMKCSPAEALFRYKYGIAMLANGYREGLLFLEESIRMEPYNPMFQYEYKTYLTKHPAQ